LILKSLDPSNDEADLIRRAKSGDAEAMNALLEPYWNSVFRLAYRMTGHAEDAEDVTQEAFVRIVQRLPSYRGECAFKTWVNRVALNVGLTARRRKRPPAAELEKMELKDPLPGPEDRAIGHELQDRANAELQKLRSVYREAILLRMAAEMSYEEIAETLQVSVNTVRLRVSRGMSQLRNRMRAWLNEEVSS
jgi:RNA polymerase sigma-70 factor (ECF subfamily)